MRAEGLGKAKPTMPDDLDNDAEVSATAPRLFVSYSRADRARVEPCVTELRRDGADVWIDTSSIEPTADWWEEIERAIRVSDAAVVFASEAFWGSDICTRELTVLRASGKKIIPIELEDGQSTRDADLNRIQWIVSRPETPPQEIAQAIRSAADADLEWSTEHAALLTRAVEWDQRGRPRSLLLRGRDIEAAESAILQTRPPSQPQPVDLQRRYIVASRRGRARILRSAMAIAIAVALLSTTLAVVAVQQRSTALNALAQSDFRRWSSQARSATTQSDALRYALEAAAQGPAAGQSTAETGTPVARALGLSSLPLMHFSGRPADPYAAGEDQGVAISADGSTMAFATTDAAVRVIDLWRVSEGASIPPFEAASTDYGAGYQLALDATGDRLARIAVPEYPEDGEHYAAVVETFELSAGESNRPHRYQVDLSSPAASIAFGTEEDALVVMEDEGTLTVANLATGDETHLGTSEVNSDASYLTTTISADGSRACSVGARFQVFQTSPPRQLLDVPNTGFGVLRGRPCMPEQCGDSPNNAMAVVEEGAAGPVPTSTDSLIVECVGSDGQSRGRSGYNAASTGGLVALRGIAELATADPLAEDFYAAPAVDWRAAMPVGEGLQPPYAQVIPPEDVVRPIAFGFAVPGATGPTVVSVGSDGDIDLWPVGTGIIPPDRTVSGHDSGMIIPRAQALRRNEPIVALADGDPDTSTALVDLESGDARPGAPFTERGETSFGERWWSLGAGSFVRVSWDDGALVESQADAATPPDLAGTVTVFSPDAEAVEYAIEVAAEPSVPPLSIGGNVLAWSDGSRVHAVNASDGSSIFTSERLEDDNYCVVGVSQDGRSLAATTCGSDGNVAVDVWAGGGARRARRGTVPYRRPSAVAVSSDGEIAAAAFEAGEVALFRGDRLLPTPDLVSVVASHNDYQIGWLSLDPGGQWLITRRDSRGTELWHVRNDGVEQVGHLSRDPRSDPPDAVFEHDSVTLAWSAGAGNPSSSMAIWSLGADDLTQAACRHLVSATDAGNLDVPEPPCASTRGEGSEPPSMPSTTSTTATSTAEGPDVAPFDLAADDPIELGEGSFPSAVTVTEDGEVWAAASSSDELVRIDSEGAPTFLPLGGTSTSVDLLVPDGDGNVWFGGFGLFGFVPDGSNQIEVLSANGAYFPGSMTYADGHVLIFAESFEPRLLEVSPTEGQSTPLGSDLANATSVGMAALDDDIWLGANLEGSSEAPALARIDPDGQVELTSLDELATLTGLAAADDGSLWFAGTRDNGSATLGRRTASGAVQYVEPPDQSDPRHVAAFGNTIWFTSDTRIGRVDATGRVDAWAVPDAEQLSAIFADGPTSAWVTDSGNGTLRHVSIASSDGE